MAHFPEGFLWGGAVAANQWEGGWNIGGRGPAMTDVTTGGTVNTPRLITYIDKDGKDSNSENPFVHQGSNSNPRTAIAKTEDNHVLFIVVDGRRSGFATGISAKNLTKFLVKNFNPQYALNLDGGGSSTMCVKGLGDPETNVVNYPCDNRSSEGKDGSPQEKPGVPDHAGQRPRDTFFVVVKK